MRSYKNKNKKKRRRDEYTSVKDRRYEMIFLTNASGDFIIDSQKLIDRQINLSRIIM